MTKRVVNFNAGPAALPLQALERAQREFLDFEGTGMSIMEHSHRGKDYERVHNEAIALLTELLQIPDDYQVLLMQGGATAQFAYIPMNLLPAGKSADFLLTGIWARKAYAEAQFVGKARIAANVEGEGGLCTRVPTQAELKLDPEAAYLHFCSNNTIMGTQFHDFPEPPAGVPLFCDMSSDILWRSIDVSKFGLIYAGAQKNIGPSGVTLVIAKKSLIAAGREDIPKIFRFKEHAKENSLLNTAPTFAIYMVRNVLQVVKEQGGVAAMEKRNREKARLVYDLIDENPSFFRSSVEKASRSVMNPVFRLPSEELDKKMVAEAAATGFVGIKGHKLVGGIRVSQYNATTPEQVAQFVEWARGFAKTNG
ncbi:MAG: 3-phosphoserine/phosphohydroxythreonine transaminase [Myxococcales bacterium]